MQPRYRLKQYGEEAEDTLEFETNDPQQALDWFIAHADTGRVTVYSEAKYSLGHDPKRAYRDFRGKEHMTPMGKELGLRPPGFRTPPPAPTRGPGRPPVLNDPVVLTTRVSRGDKEFIIHLGDGSFSLGFRRAVEKLRFLE